MADDTQKKLLETIQKLERRVLDLTRRVQKLETQLDDPWFRTEDADEPGPAPASTHARTTPSPTPPKDEVSQGEFWLNKIGIALLLLGLAFLLKHSLDQEWMTPTVRVLLGGVLGGVLLALGMRLHASHKILSPVLQGGGIAAFYMTVFAAFQLYHLIPHLFAFSIMVGITVLAFTLAARQYEFALSLVAVTGGLGTPFLLHTDTGNIPALVLYTGIVLAGAMTIYYYRPWRSLLWYSWAGGWIVLAIAEDQLPRYTDGGAFPFWSVQAGVLFAFALFWIVPLLTKQRQWKPVPLSKPDAAKTVFENLFAAYNLPVTAIMLLSGIIAWLLPYAIWTLPDKEWGWILSAFSLLFVLTAFLQWRRGAQPEPVALHATLGTFLLTVALWHLLRSDALFFAYGVEATVLHLLGRRTREHVVTYAGTALFVLLNAWLVTRILGAAPDTAILNLRAGADLVFILLLVYWATLMPRTEETQGYLLVAYVDGLAWLWRELSVLDQGNAWVSTGWGVTGTLLLWAGLRHQQMNAFRVGFGTLVLVAFKLTLLDLAHLSVLTRVLIFMGFGAAFLWISSQMKSPQPASPSGKTA